MTGSSTNVVIIGAGLGGLTAAAALAQYDLNVTVLEAQAIPGGCASTFYHQGYRFDTGATLAGGFYPYGPMDLVGRVAGIHHWPAVMANPVMQVRLSDGIKIPITGSSERWDYRRRAFGPGSEKFWNWQEQTADLVWNLALRLPAWPPQSFSQLFDLLNLGIDGLIHKGMLLRLPFLLSDAFRPISAHLSESNPRLKEFLDAQLLISAQATSERANSLYGAAALDLPRRGIAHIAGGIGAIAQNLVKAIQKKGGRVLFHQEVKNIIIENNRPRAVITRRGEQFQADIAISNLPAWNTAQLLEPDIYPALSTEKYPVDGWGAYVLYVGVDETLIPKNYPLHHQVIIKRPLGEGNSIFLSISPEWDTTRAPNGKRAITISTHTSLAPWWDLYENDPDAYQARKRKYMDLVLAAAETILPGIREAADLMLPGTPVTFQRFTRRTLGWVGGYPQTRLFRSAAPRLGENLWMVGDSIFPGQSTAATALGGLRVAKEILKSVNIAALPNYENQLDEGQRSNQEILPVSGLQIAPTPAERPVVNHSKLP